MEIGLWGGAVGFEDAGRKRLKERGKCWKTQERPRVQAILQELLIPDQLSEESFGRFHEDGLS